MKANILILLTLLLLSCNGKKEKKNISTAKKAVTSDTIIKSSIIILTYPSENEINFLKKKHGEEDFYAIADDANHYQYKCFELLDSINQKYVTSKKQIFKFKNGYIVDKKNYDNKWLVVDYRDIESNPKMYSHIDFIENYSSANITPKSKNGIWRIHCKEGSGNLIINNKMAFIEVNSNQIYIDAFIKKQNDSIHNLYLNSTKDLGSGGIRLNWDSFSKDSLIASFKYSQKYDYLTFNWRGFYDIEAKKRVWKSDSDFQLTADKTKNIKLIKCK